MISKVKSHEISKAKYSLGVRVNQDEQEKLLASLRQEEQEILSELASFAKEDPHSEDGFMVPFPNEGTGMDENAREIQDFERMNALKHNLAQRLQNIRKTIKKIGKGVYGQCEICSASIESSRLKAMPVARFCIDCANQHSREA